MNKILLICIIAAAIAPQAMADTLILKNGARVDCDILEETDEYYTVSVAGGKVTFNRYEVQSVSREAPSGEFMEDLAAKQRAKGLIEYKDRWVTKEEFNRLQALEAQMRAESSSVPRGYGLYKFGMTNEQIEDIIMDEGKVFRYDEKKMLYTNDTLFDEPAEVRCWFTPTSKKCFEIDIALPATVDFYRIESALTAKYGKSDYPMEYSPQGYRSTAWEKGDALVILMDGEIVEYPDTLVVGYISSKLREQKYKEQAKLDAESKNKM